MTGKTGFWTDERCFWHVAPGYVGTLDIGGMVEPMSAGGSAESPESKRRLRNLVEVSGLMAHLDVRSGEEADDTDILRVHDRSYVDAFRKLSAAGGGEIGHHASFGPGGFEIAALSAGLAKAALSSVLDGTQKNAYALCRPPGHHCRSDGPMGFCLLNNIAIAVDAAIANGQAGRVVVLDWDVHHGNGTEQIFYERGDVLTISIHQDRNYPIATGRTQDRGAGAGQGANINIPLMPGAGHDSYCEALEKVVVPAIRAFQPDVIVVACGFDASACDPLSRMLAHSDTFATMTRMVMATASDVCSGKLVLCHEGGYSETYVPFCGHAAIAALAGDPVAIEDPLLEVFRARQPGARFVALQSVMIDEIAAYLESG